ncbi:TatD family hydrolase [Candidatus Blochmanniella vafra str. BVAF]|uniref:TatD family hydrolase n=1 Tax=Blochmanniella vafra (strain BVAF) TaxID=859654 RepID=E8Q6A1_BLOVB|nr:YchF/TatD family DNA exonuclease [Candidatus Blochmannia vafer]ADV33795.1 TatD family hydrolase [Candidatus Blochmannia vafer str. BVAF]
MFLIDSHCHLNKLNYHNVHADISDVLSKAYQKGVKLVLSVSTDLSDYENMIQFVGYRKDVLFSCGIHPMNICDFTIKRVDLNKLNNFVFNDNVIAIGETGLDYYHNISNKNVQKEIFCQHIDIAKNIDKPLVVHSRNAMKDVLILLNETGAKQCKGVLHCFCDDIDSARILLNMNFYISFSGMVTFKNIDNFKKVIQYVPENRMLLETDSPYLTPVPYRGLENQPAYVYDIARYISDIKKISLDEIASITTSNFCELFRVEL